MNADELLRYYERVADAPDAVARLRRFVLDLAVRGKLVAQEPTDQPAAKLLVEVAAEKVKYGSNRDVSPLDHEEVPFTLPLGWAWARLGEICTKTGSGSTPRGGQAAYKAHGIPFLRSQNIYDDGLRISDVAYIDEETHAGMSGTAVQPGDLLLNITGGSIGRCSRVPKTFGAANVSQHVAIIRPAVLGLGDFLHWLVLSPYFQAFVSDEQTGAGRGGLPKGRMDRIAVATPPLAEQHRIVAKVDELMALCDRLETARVTRESARDRLAAASLARLNAPDPETFHEDTSFALDALPALTTRPGQIKQLRQTILNLAVRGHLVLPDSDDEPVAKLLGRLARGLEEAPVAPRASESGPVSPYPTSEIPLDLPDRWSWIRAESAAVAGQTITYGILKPVWVESGVRTVRVTEMKSGSINVATLPMCEPERASKFGKTTLEVGDLLVSKDGTIGKTAFVPEGLQGGNITQHVLRFPITPFLNTRFIRLFIDSPLCQSWLSGETKGIALQGVNVGDFRRMPIPIPPLKEQARIVGKVDELMSLCDRLEASLASTDTHRRRLLEALLHEALQPAEALEEAA